MLCDLWHTATKVLSQLCTTTSYFRKWSEATQLVKLDLKVFSSPQGEGGFIVLDLNPPCHMFVFKSDPSLLPAILACGGRSKTWTWGRGSSNGSHPCALQLFSLWKQRGGQQDQMCHRSASLLAQWRLNRAPTSVIWEEFTWEGWDTPPFNPMWLLNDPFCSGVISDLFHTAALMHYKVVLR